MRRIVPLLQYPPPLPRSQYINLPYSLLHIRDHGLQHPHILPRHLLHPHRSNKSRLYNHHNPISPSCSQACTSRSNRTRSSSPPTPSTSNPFSCCHAHGAFCNANTT